MTHSRKQWKLGAVMLGSCMLLCISTASIAETQLTVENDGMALTAIVSSSKDILSTSIRVVGPDGFVSEDRIEDGALQWVPEGDLADGRYKWEVRTVTVTPGAPMIEISAPQAPAPIPTGQQSADESSANPANPEQPAVEIPIERYFEEADKRVHTESGSFDVRDGLMVPNVNEQEAISRLEPARPGLLGSIAGAVLDFVFPSAHADQLIADDLSLEDLSPCLRYDDTSTTGVNWNACGWDNNGFFIIELGSTVSSNAQFAIENSAPASSLYISSSGNGNIGLGTSTPGQDLHIVAGRPGIAFDDSTDAQIWQLQADGNSGGRFRISDTTAGTVPFRIDAGAPTDSIRIASSGRVGIGTDDPQTDLHVVGSNIRIEQIFSTWDINPGFSGMWFNRDTPASTFGVLKLQNDAPADSIVADATGVGFGTDSPASPIHVVRDDDTFEFLILDQQNDSVVQDRQMMQLNNNGGIRFQFDNDALGTSWRFQAATGNQDVFEIAKVGTGTIEMTVDASGNLTTAGTVNGSSSRAVKNSIEPVDNNDILMRLRNLAVAEWTYNRDPEGLRHLGPMAEDFYETFGLGVDDKHISPSDLAGVALTAAKALIDRNQEQQDLIDVLREQLEVQEERIIELESQNQAIRSSLVELRELRVEVEQLKANWPSVSVALEN